MIKIYNKYIFLIYKLNFNKNLQYKLFIKTLKCNLCKNI